MVELKAVGQLEDMHLAQAMSYLEAYGLNAALLNNFGNRSLQYKSVMLPYRKKGHPPNTPQS